MRSIPLTPAVKSLMPGVQSHSSCLQYKLFVVGTEPVTQISLVVGQESV